MIIPLQNVQWDFVNSAEKFVKSNKNNKTILLFEKTGSILQSTELTGFC